MSFSTYDDPTGVIVASAILEAIAILCVGLRFYSRKWKKQNFITSDWLILVALVFGTGLTAMEIYGVDQHALGYPIGGTFADPIVLTRFDIAKKIDLSMLLIGVIGVGFLKLSVCFLYWHLFSRVVFRRFLIVWIVIVSLWTVAFVLAILLECGTHLSATFGTPDEYFEYCGSAIPAGYAMMATDLLTDIVTLTIPIPVILSLRMDTRTRLLTLLTFMIGSLSVGASIAKTYIYIITALGQQTEDAMLTLTGLSIWNLVEVQVGIVAACGPTLRHIIVHVLPTESVKSLMSLLGISQPSKKSTVELPSFVKSPESVEQMHHTEQPVSVASLKDNAMDDYELEFLTESTHHGSHV